MDRAKKQGRKQGSRNRGFFFRKGRGWCTSEGNRAIPLRDEDGQALREQDTPVAVLKDALKRYQQQPTEPTEATEQAGPIEQTTTASNSVTVLEACTRYLDHAKATGASSTYVVRADALFDFCFGLPARFRTPGKYVEGPKDRIHKGYGKLPVQKLTQGDIDQWLAKHPTWKGCRRTKIQAVKRALNYGVKAGLLTRNPIRGYKSPKVRMRQTYLTEAQEAACYRLASPALAQAIKVCIRTGARFGCEFTRLTSKHVTMTPKGVEWRFSEDESKTGKLRIIRIPNTDEAGREVIEIVRSKLEKIQPGKPLFRNKHNKPWTRHGLSGEFSRLRAKLAKEGIELDDDSCMYACRHTFAKRCLSGFWSGKPTTIEVLSGLMGNSREVCWNHYADWCESYSDPLWESA